MKKLLVIFAALTISVGASAQSWAKALQGGIKAAKAMTISDSEMAEMARQSVAQLDAQNKIAPANSPYTERLNRVTAGITDADGIPLNFKVYILGEVNAFACPDGSVRVYSGLMDLMNDDELIGVIGHEIGHVLKRHSKKAYRAALLTSAGRDALSARGGKLGALTDSQLGDIGESLINSKYSRSEEKEADDVGYDFLVKNKRNPWAMAMAFEKMQQLEQQSGVQQSAIAKMFSSHPDLGARIKKMTLRATRDGYPRP